MGHRFADILFTDPVKSVQVAENGSDLFEKWSRKDDFNCNLSEREANFLSDRESFYIASVSPDGWPYIQHRGGHKGFIKVIDERHIGFADFTGNRQYITTGQLRANNRVSCFFMDYRHKRRLKMLGRATEVNTNDLDAMNALIDPNNPSQVERGFIIRVEAFDWNCSKHIPNFVLQP
ncbi:pyridoxamine 5'-phosphate oxidase family protein [Aurantivibrio plasticivorans]